MCPSEAPYVVSKLLCNCGKSKSLRKEMSFPVKPTAKFHSLFFGPLLIFIILKMQDL